MGTDDDRNQQSQLQQGQSQSQSQRPDDLTKKPREDDEVGRTRDQSPVGSNPERDHEDDAQGHTSGRITDADRDVEGDPDSPLDRLQDHDKIEGRERIEELKRQQRDQIG